jgi:hypothetical protein
VPLAFGRGIAAKIGQVLEESDESLFWSVSTLNPEP